MKHIAQKTIGKLHGFLTGNYNVLLMFLVLLFVFRPEGYEVVYLSVWKFCFVGAILFAVFNVRKHLLVRVIASILAFPSVLFAWLEYFYVSPVIVLIIVSSTVLFLSICVGFILFDVILKAKVTLETLRGAVCAYFLIAFLFAYLYIGIEDVIPGTFWVRGQIEESSSDIFHFFSQMLYFSFVALLTIGFGDIIAVKSIGQTAVVMEGIVGQFYIAILISRLVSVYSFVSDKRIFQNLIEEFHQKKD